MTLRGDWAKVGRILNRLQEAASGRLYERAKLAAAEQALALVHEGFREQRDPDMNPWAALRAQRRRGKRGSAKILMDTGRLRASFTRRVTADGFRIGSSVSYAGFHQRGTRKMTKRSMVPSGPLSAYWATKMNRAIARVPRLHFAR